MKPGVSAQRTAVLRIAATKLAAAASAAGEVSMPSISSTSRTAEAGCEEVQAEHALRPRRHRAPARSTESDEVVDARIARPGTAASSAANTDCLSSSVLGHRLDHEVDVAERAVARRRR